MTDEVTLRGTVERVTYQNPENGYTVARLDAGQSEAVTVVGVLPGLRVGDSVEVSGCWVNHPRFGRQLRATLYHPLLPSTREGIRRYLGSGIIPGIGPALAERIVERFGEETLELIEREPQRLREVPGLGEKKIAVLLEAWQERRAERDLMVFLRSHGIGQALAARILTCFGAEAPSVVRHHPFRLAAEVPGIGFPTADAIARRVGFEPTSFERVGAGLTHLLSQAADEGHVFLTREELLAQAGDLLEVSWDRLEESLAEMGREGWVVEEGERVYLPGFHRAEEGAARALRTLIQAPPVASGARFEDLLREVEEDVGLRFEAVQREAILRALQARILVLTGGPGTGKTTVNLGVIEMAERLGRQVLLSAPTGRAAKRMGEVTGRPAQTIHRLLEYSPREGRFRRGPEHPLEADLIVVDEASMMDLPLLYHLLTALPVTGSLLLVGDVDQLPPVGVGMVLHDIIASRQVEVVRLTQIFRQAEESFIVLNAHRINAGLFPLLRGRKEEARDFFLLEEEDPARVAELVIDLASDRLPRRYGFDPLLDIQVLTPMYRGATGAHSLNEALQDRLNHEGQELERGAPRLRVGDKVMQVKNNYEREVFNGDLGVVAAVNPAAGAIQVRFDRLVPYSFDDLDELVLAYAITVHKSQGSEYRAVIMPITTQHYVMLQRNLLYTAVTRARDLVVLVGTKQALAMAVRNDRVEYRRSWLAERIRGE